MPKRRDQLDKALEVFARAWTFTRSFTHPYLAERVEGMWVIRDGPRKNGKYRSEEWIASGIAPERVDRIVRARTRGRFSICRSAPKASLIRVYARTIGRSITGSARPNQ